MMGTSIGNMYLLRGRKYFLQTIAMHAELVALCVLIAKIETQILNNMHECT